MYNNGNKDNNKDNGKWNNGNKNINCCEAQGNAQTKDSIPSIGLDFLLSCDKRLKRWAFIYIYIQGYAKGYSKGYA